MKNMFYNYDHNIKKDLQAAPHFPFGYPAILESDPNISIIKDAKGREIGVRVKQGMPFTLYFYLDDYMTARKISELPAACDYVIKSICHFEIVSARHKVIYSAEYNAAEIFNTNTSKLAINVPLEAASLLKKDTYRMRLTLTGLIGDLDGKIYTLFDDDDGLLIVR